MPYQRRRTKRKRRSTWRKKRSRAVQPRAPIADSQVVKLKYGELLTLTSSAGLAATHVFSANNCFDPNTTGVGHQPMGFDEWMQFYNHFTVLGSKIKVTYMPANSGAGGAALCSIKLQDDATAVVTINDSILEQTGVVWKALGGDTAQGSQTLKKYFSAKKFFDVADVKDNSQFNGTHTSSPTEQAFYHLSISGIDGTAVTCYFAVEIEYIVRLSERSTLLQS